MHGKQRGAAMFKRVALYKRYLFYIFNLFLDMELRIFLWYVELRNGLHISFIFLHYSWIWARSCLTSNRERLFFIEVNRESFIWRTLLFGGICNTFKYSIKILLYQISSTGILFLINRISYWIIYRLNSIISLSNFKNWIRSYIKVWKNMFKARFL